jgi:hypothetical protein
MKNRFSLFSLCLLGLLFSGVAHAQTVAGGALVYGLDAETAGIRGEYYHDLSTAVPKLRVGGDFTYRFPKSEGSAEVTWTELNVNAHYAFMEKFYGKAGLYYAMYSVTVDLTSIGGGKATVDETSSGLQLGGGSEVPLSETLSIYGEIDLRFGDAGEIIAGVGVRTTL